MIATRIGSGEAATFPLLAQSFVTTLTRPSIPPSGNVVYPISVAREDPRGHGIAHHVDKLRAGNQACPPSSERSIPMQRRHVAGLMFALMFLLISTATPFSGAQAATGSTPYVGFRKQTTAADFAGSKLAGVKIGSIAGNASIQLAASGLRHGTNSRLYGSQSYWYGTLESPVLSAAHLFDTAV